MSPAAAKDEQTARRAFLLIILCGCLVAIITFGVRSTFGLFTEPVSSTRGWGRETFALAIAIQNLLWGLGQPVAGAIADRWGSARVLAGGCAIYAAGVALMAVSDTPLAMHMSGGVLVGLGMSGGSFTIVIAAFARLVPPERRPWAMGVATAAGSAGQFLFAPLGLAFISTYGWPTAFMMLASFLVLAIVLAAPLRSKGSGAGHGETDLGFADAMRAAFGHRSYVLLVTGFFVCGFQLSFITVHLPPYLSDIGIDAAYGAWAISLIGLFNIVGSYMAGILGGRFSKPWLLSGLYLGRAVMIAIFILMPAHPYMVLAFAAIMGLMWLSTVPLTSALVAVMFGTRYLGTLFGVVFFSHQVGSFLGVWLGGYLYDRFGSYDAVWWGSIALGVMAALVHLPIVERPAESFAAVGVK